VPKQLLCFWIGQDFKARVETSFNGTLAQKICAKPMNRIDLRLFEMGYGMLKVMSRLTFTTHSLQLLTETKLEFTSSFVCKSHGQDLIHAGFPSGQDIDYPRNKLGCLTCASCGFDK
jgi:hypothetical protein